MGLLFLILLRIDHQYNYQNFSEVHIFLYLLFFISIVTVPLMLLFYKKESWSNTYSGWPGPIENPYATNVPALYGNPKYMSKCKYTYNPKSTTGYLSMKNLPN